ASGSYIYVKEPVFAIGDLLWYKDYDLDDTLTISSVQMTVTAGPTVVTNNGVDHQRYTVTADSGSLADLSAGGTVVRVGNTTDTDRQGALYMDASSTFAPFMDIIDGVDSWAAFGAAAKTKVRLGNLEGITSDAEYGLWAGEGVGVGDSYLLISNVNMELHDIPMFFYDSGNNQRVGIVPDAGSTDKLLWAGESESNPGLVVYGDGDVWLSTLAISEQMGDMLFSQADGLALWGPGCAITPTSWTSTRGQVATISGAFHQVQGPWANSKALVVEPSATNRVQNTSAEIDVSGWSFFRGGAGGSLDRSTTRAWHGGSSFSLFSGNSWCVAQETTGTVLANGESVTVSAYFYRGSSFAASLKIRDTTNNVDRASVRAKKVGRWERVIVRWENTTGDDVTVIAKIDNTAADSTSVLFFDGVQREHTAYYTSFIDSTLGTGYSLSGTAHLRATTIIDLSAFAPLVSGKSTLTIATWLQTQYDADDANWPCGTNGAYIFDYWADASNQVALWFDPTTDDRLRLWINNAARVNVTGQTFKSGDLLHLVVTLDFDNDIYTLYLNGATVGSSTALLSAPTATTFKLGIRNDNNASYMGGWRFGEYAVFGRVLTAEEVAALYARGKPLADAGAFKRPGIYIMDGEIDLRTSQTGARVQIDADGIGGYSATTTKTFSLETDGDLFLGSDIGAAGTTALAVFANAQTYGTASESMGAGDVLLGDNSAGKINLLWDVSEGDVILRRGTSARITLDGSADSILIGQVAASQNNILISSGAISIRNNNVERIGVTAAGILTIKDSGGNAVITLDASAGAEIAKTLAMKGASAAISIGETPPASATSGTGIWIDRTGFYSLSSDDYQVKIDATDGKLYAGNGNIILGNTGIEYIMGETVYEHIIYRRSLDGAVGGKIYSSGGGVNSYTIQFGTISTEGSVNLQAIGASNIVGFDLESSTDKIIVGASNVQLGTRSATKIYLGGSTYYLYLSGSDLYWWNGSTGTKLN
ncbi:MAG: LamG-like jellyroll fold domain-containing protein, partial [Dehalococcoidia bacterium]